jgi:hypothetical protein
MVRPFETRLAGFSDHPISPWAGEKCRNATEKCHRHLSTRRTNDSQRPAPNNAGSLAAPHVVFCCCYARAVSRIVRWMTRPSNSTTSPT